jgi:hypothetical protein
VTAKVQIAADIPEPLLRTFLQYIRNFDVAHDGCHFGINVAAPGMTVDRIEAVLDEIKPPFPIREVHKMQ